MYEESAKTANEISSISGGGLLDGKPILRRTLMARYAYLDPLNIMQVELLKRARSAETTDTYQRGLLLAINGIAAGTRSTG